MNWNSKYKRETQATWEDLARAVRDAVTMRDVIAAYVPEANPRGRRMPCPIHNGKDNNFSFTDDRFTCFVCNESGDAIEFVKLVCGLRSRTDAIKQINADFRLGLPLGRGITREENKALEERKKRAKQMEEKSKRLWNIYHAALDFYIALDIIKREQAPKNEDDPITMQYAYACRKIDGAWYDVEQAMIALNNFEKEGEQRLN